MLSWFISIACVKGRESLWTTFFPIMRFLGPYGMFSLVDSGCLGLCLNEQSTYMRVGGLLVALGCCYVGYGVFMSIEGNE